jgi:hypothetical protein
MGGVKVTAWVEGIQEERARRAMHSSERSCANTTKQNKTKQGIWLTHAPTFLNFLACLYR